MRSRKLILISLLLLILLQTSYFWPRIGNGFEIIMALLVVVMYVFVLAVSIYFVYKSVRERFCDRQRNRSLVVGCSVLILSFFFPSGIIDFERFEPPDLLIASYEGVANCTTTLKLKPENKCVLISICFGLNETRGTYRLWNDTIRIHFEDDSTFAILKRDSVSGQPMSVLYGISNKSRPFLPMKIYKNELVTKR